MSRIIIGLCLLLVFVLPIRAQDSRPAHHQLYGLTPIWQDFNRCSAAAFTMQLSYFDWHGTYTDVVNRLNPNPDDVSVRLEEMAEFAVEEGFGALAWIWARSDKTLPIPGFRTEKQVTENCGALAFDPLTAEQVREIDTILNR